MFKRVRLFVYISFGCLLAGGVFYAVWNFLPHGSLQQLMSAPSDPETNASDTGNTNEEKDAPEPSATLAETPLPDGYFQLIVKSHTTIKQADASPVYDGDVELKYAHQKTAGGILLTLYSMGLQLIQDGTLTENDLMTRDKMVQQNGDQKTVTPFDELSPEQQAMLMGAFATNLCKITLDANQNELGRQILSEAGYAMIKEGNLNALRLMHGAYHHEADHWQDTKRIPMAMGFDLDCPLQFSRDVSQKNLINITGSLSKDEVGSAQSDMVMKNVSFKLSGKESFDETIGEYTSGEINLQYRFQVFQRNAQIASLDGKISLSLNRVTTKITK